jgi:hypothetical protein
MHSCYCYYYWWSHFQQSCWTDEVLNWICHTRTILDWYSFWLAPIRLFLGHLQMRGLLRIWVLLLIYLFLGVSRMILIRRYFDFWFICDVLGGHIQVLIILRETYNKVSEIVGDRPLFTAWADDFEFFLILTIWVQMDIEERSNTFRIQVVVIFQRI